MGLSTMPGVAEVTIVVAPREKYRCARGCLVRLLTMEGPPFELVWVDESRAPARLRRWTRDQASQSGFRYLSLPGRAGANECRMRGFDHVTTPYAVFLDNDAHLGDGSLAALLDCARSTGAAFVSPLYLFPDGAVHYAGGLAELVDDEGGRRLVERHAFRGCSAEEIRRVATRQPTDAPELHGVLVRSDALRAAGGMDTELWGSMDCLDLAFGLRATGGQGWIEPAASVTYDRVTPRPRDLPLFFSRWSRAAVEQDVLRFAARWQLEPADQRLDEHRATLAERRRLPLRYPRGAIRRLLGERALDRFDGPVDAVIDRLTAGSRRTR